MTAARLADGGVLELSRRPPEILLLGASVVQEAKWCSVGQRLMSVPISAMSCSAACGPMEWIWLRSAPPVRTCSGVRMSKAGACFLVGLARGVGSAVEGGGCWAASVLSNASISVFRHPELRAFDRDREIECQHERPSAADCVAVDRANRDLIEMRQHVERAA